MTDAASNLPGVPAPDLRHRGLHVAARRFINPLVDRFGLAGGRRSPLAVVVSVGRRSGRLHETPLAVHRRGHTLIVPLTYGPAARWCLNVLAAGECRVRRRGSEVRATDPRLVARAALPQPLRAFYGVVGIRDFLALRIAAPR